MHYGRVAELEVHENCLAFSLYCEKFQLSAPVFAVVQFLLQHSGNSFVIVVSIST